MSDLKTMRVMESNIMSNTKLCKQNWLQQTATIFHALRQEAIKRVKNCHDSCSKKFRCKACKRDMWFNNLTDEDLVEKKSGTTIVSVKEVTPELLEKEAFKEDKDLK